MSAVSMPSRQKSWQDSRQRVSVLAELAIHKKTVVDKLASLREDHDLTQEKAAQAVGVTVRQWQRWESGQSVPYPRNLDAIAARFSFDVSEFFSEEAPTRSEDGEPTQLDRLESKLNTLLEHFGLTEAAEDPAKLAAQAATRAARIARGERDRRSGDRRRKDDRAAEG